MSFRKQRPKPNLKYAVRRKETLNEENDCILVESNPIKSSNDDIYSSILDSNSRSPTTKENDSRITEVDSVISGPNSSPITKINDSSTELDSTDSTIEPNSSSPITKENYSSTPERDSSITDYIPVSPPVMVVGHSHTYLHCSLFTPIRNTTINENSQKNENCPCRTMLVSRTPNSTQPGFSTLFDDYERAIKKRNLKSRPKPNFESAVSQKLLKFCSEENECIIIHDSTSESESSSQTIAVNSQESVIVISSEGSQPVEIEVKQNDNESILQANNTTSSSTYETDRHFTRDEVNKEENLTKLPLYDVPRCHSKSARKASLRPKPNLSLRRKGKGKFQLESENTEDEKNEKTEQNCRQSAKKKQEVSAKSLGVRTDPKTTCKNLKNGTSKVIVEIEKKDVVSSDVKASDISLMELPPKESQIVINSSEVEQSRISTVGNVTINEAKSNDSGSTSGTPSSHYRRPNLVKPNLSTANRIVRPSQSSSSYGKFANVARQRFRNKFGAGLPEHSKLTMLDLIFYNPPNNPMSGGDCRKKSTNNDEIDLGPLKENKPEPTKVKDNGCSDRNASDANTPENYDIPFPEPNGRAVDKNGVPVPQLKVTADGKVIIAPESLVVAGSKETVNPESRPLIVENDFTHHKVSSNKLKREKTTWTFQETIQFYKVLQTTGADFTLMAEHLPERTRNCLKRKFKKEEKVNSHLIDKVLGTSNGADLKQVEKDLALNRMLDQLEKSCKKRTEAIPDILDICDGVNPHMFLTKKEKLDLKKKDENSNVEDQREQNKNGDDEIYLKCILNDDNRTSNNMEPDSSNNNKSVVTMKEICRGRRRKQVLNLKEIVSNNKESSIQTSLVNRNKKRNKNSIFNNVSERNRNKLKDLENSGNQEEINVLESSPSNNKNENTAPIVVNTSIEASNIKYTKSITFNLNNMETPVDINETIAHIGNTEFPHSTYIINEIVDILSNEDQSFYITNDK